MKFKIKKNMLLAHLNLVEKAVDNKNAMYSIIEIVADDNLILKAANVDLTIVSTIDNNQVDIEEVGFMRVNGKLFVEIIRKLDDKEIVFETNDNKVTIKCERSRYSLNLLDVIFLDKKEAEYDIKTIIKAEELKKLIQKTIIASGSNKIVLQGINFKTAHGQLIATASDGYRVARDFFPSNFDKEINVIVPSTALSELSKVLNFAEVEINLNKKDAKFKYGPTNFYIRLIEGTFPNVETFFVKTNQVTINRIELIKVIERASVLLDAEGYLRFEFKENELLITSKKSQIGQAYEIINMDNPNKFNLVIGFTTKYLLDGLKTFNSENININVSEPRRPMLLSGDEKESLLHVIMPIQINEGEY